MESAVDSTPMWVRKSIQEVKPAASLMCCRVSPAIVTERFLSVVSSRTCTSTGEKSCTSSSTMCWCFTGLPGRFWRGPSRSCHARSSSASSSVSRRASTSWSPSQNLRTAVVCSVVQRKARSKASSLMSGPSASASAARSVSRRAQSHTACAAPARVTGLRAICLASSSDTRGCSLRRTTGSGVSSAMKGGRKLKCLAIMSRAHSVHVVTCTPATPSAGKTWAT